ncbi:hypothetical protein BELL_1100g00020 [Botrytis elliptica]|uniref:GH16 domain-containing protein n=1 Tax=Botrytis elliptica TaxID=278938 RepID=A0A4Z1IQF2_9HELO|nr:hypothetical protein EAE99_007508 [Botrytis elliptica]TGO62874.1 hypothetical protein BELL_1100g00020 [Botrytis elliptica]
MKHTFPSLSHIALSLLSISITLPLTHAGAPPKIPGFTLTWSDSFSGSAGSLASSSKWEYETPATNQNNEIQHYTSSPQNANLSGSSTLYITPLYSSGKWTSARISTLQSWGCANGAEMIVSASIKMGSSDPTHQQGIWPAFWTLGESFRSDNMWPECGEWDIMEQVNGASANVGTIHYGTASYPLAIGSPNAWIDRSEWHTYGIRISRVGDWQSQSITWELDGNAYFTVTGGMVGDYQSWGKLVGESYFVILNVAVGGSYPGMPNALTKGGVGSGMEVGFVAVYNGAGAGTGW